MVFEPFDPFSDVILSHLLLLATDLIMLFSSAKGKHQCPDNFVKGWRKEDENNYPRRHWKRFSQYKILM